MPPSSSILGGRFAPGSVVADRFRIVALLGRGGMGEVYRAEDMRLQQVVAVKFLPEAATADPGLRERLLEEVRLARQVTHAGVCRVHDLGEYEGQLFLSMEYVDGEDLSQLLRRIGRLPEEKSIDLARQLCAGLGAAHTRGIVHRDLKPANIMVDGEGRVRITDFGLAVATSEGVASGLAGTPAYMAPEQLEGGEVTHRSDLYALGLVLYELFTGRSVFGDLHTIDAQARARRDRAYKPPSSLVGGLDAAVESVIERCLELEPEERPASAMAVAAGLPGGDPLAEALAAGETPSPEMIAAAGGVGTLRPWLAWLLVLFSVVSIVYTGTRHEELFLTRAVELPLAPEVLKHRAQEILSDFGATERGLDDEWGFGYSHNWKWHLYGIDFTPTRWERLATDLPSTVVFWYREGFGYMYPDASWGGVWHGNPAFDRAGMRRVLLSPAGKLIHFERRPGPWSGAPAEEVFDWSIAFAAAGLELSEFTPVEPARLTPYPQDERWAWTGVYPEEPEVALRVEAGALEGRPLHFELLGPWELPEGLAPQAGSTGSTETETESEAQSSSSASLVALLGRLRQILGELIDIMLLGGGFVAYRSLKRGLGDKRGASRVFWLYVALGILTWIGRAHHVGNMAYEVDSFFETLRYSLFQALFAWLVYIAFEPYVRRTWPNGLVTWNRLLAGRWRDPMVGREVLVGVALGCAVLLSYPLVRSLALSVGVDPLVPSADNIRVLRGLGATVAELCLYVGQAIVMTFSVVLMLVLMRWVLRKRALAIVAVVVFMGLSSPYSVRTGLPWTELPQQFLGVGLMAYVILRVGILALAVGAFTLVTLTAIPVTFDWSRWSQEPSIPVVLVLAGLLVFGLRVATRPPSGR